MKQLGGREGTCVRKILLSQEAWADTRQSRFTLPQASYEILFSFSFLSSSMEVLASTYSDVFISLVPTVVDLARGLISFIPEYAKEA